jgi:hypothetical protein
VSHLRQDRRGRDRMIVGFINTYKKSAPITTNVVSSNLSQAITTLCDKVCLWLATGWWFSSGSSVSSINKTYCHDISEILLKVALNIITPNPSYWTITSFIAIKLFVYDICTHIWKTTNRNTVFNILSVLKGCFWSLSIKLVLKCFMTSGPAVMKSLRINSIGYFYNQNVGFLYL